MADFITQTMNIIWSWPLLILCLGAGVFFSWTTRFVQIRHFANMWRQLFGGKNSTAGISSFQAFSVSLSGRVGVGNIAGVATAIGFGGPSAVFWMWVVAFFGASTAYIESTLGQIYKTQLHGQFRGGPAFYFEKCLGLRWFALLFAVSSVIACGLFLPETQANAVGNAVIEMIGERGHLIATPFGEISEYKLYTLLFILTVLGIIIFGGVKRIATVTQYLVPFMALAYVTMAAVILMAHFRDIPAIFSLIFSDIFNPQAGLGAALGWGVKRGVYSNEAGQGSGPHAAAAAEVDHPAQQGLVQAFSVYIDTLLICTATALMILITQKYNIQGALPDGQFLTQYIDASAKINSADFTQMAVTTTFGQFGNSFVAAAVLLFAFTTILAYYYIAETNVAYLNQFWQLPYALTAIKCLIMLAVSIGFLFGEAAVWGLGDIGVGIMAWQNIIGILLISYLGSPAIKALKDYEKQRKDKLTPLQFNPKALGIQHATFWQTRYNEQQQSKDS
ncbi:alanine/glycine:cation symporter family protein [Ostreibacterium oceani]|uniref:Amino acid carrier protein n=1 Tax=Ostreibacterium oceani TaxID=2654998 RepID=A0A6N7F257_9GAMM|nr:alanine/glycine:cation symporter family protein [Ostreibacterium oceani]MPV86878.1 amino acid carrier protein [Ostreibacterium oceani]